MILEGGLEMAAQFGGNAFVGDKKIDMPNGIKDFFKVFIPSGGDSSTPTGEQTNVYGNHLGSWNFLHQPVENGTKRLDNPVPLLRTLFLKTIRQMFGEYGWKDCPAGIVK
ncbi:MAG: hypothetical protein ACLVEJ_11205 [Parabacteroides sp.]